MAVAAAGRWFEDQSVVAARHTKLHPIAPAALQQPHGQGVEELVAQNRGRRPAVDRVQRFDECGCEPPVASFGSGGGGALDADIDQVLAPLEFLRGGRDVAGERAVPAANLHHPERPGLPQRRPHVVEVSRQQRAEEPRVNRDAGEVVGRP